MIEPSVRLAITLRLLAGGAQHNQMLRWGIGYSTVYDVFKSTITAINEVLIMTGIAMHDARVLERVATEFSNSKQRTNPL